MADDTQSEPVGTHQPAEWPVQGDGRQYRWNRPDDGVVIDNVPAIVIALVLEAARIAADSGMEPVEDDPDWMATLARRCHEQAVEEASEAGS